MTKYIATIAARQEGAIGSHGTIHRKYTIEANDRSSVNQLAIDKAYQDGGVEHVTVVRVTQVS